MPGKSFDGGNTLSKLATQRPISQSSMVLLKVLEDCSEVADGISSLASLVSSASA